NPADVGGGAAKSGASVSSVRYQSTQLHILFTGSHDRQPTRSREAQDEAAVPPEQRSVPDENRVEVLLRELQANRLEVFLDSHLAGHYGEPEGRSRELRLSPAIWSPASSGITEHRYSGQLRDGFLQDFELLGKADVPHESRHVRGGPGRAANKTVAHGV